MSLYPLSLFTTVDSYLFLFSPILLNLLTRNAIFPVQAMLYCCSPVYRPKLALHGIGTRCVMNDLPTRFWPRSFLAISSRHLLVMLTNSTAFLHGFSGGLLTSIVFLQYTTELKLDPIQASRLSCTFIKARSFIPLSETIPPLGSVP